MKPASEPPLRGTPAPKEERREGKEGRARFEILSWNINGISHLLLQTQPSIKSFFRKSSGSGARQTPETEDEVDIRQYATAEAPLRKFLRRHGFPQIVCLQEVKISPKDKMARKAVERAANGGDAPGYKASFELPRDKFNATGWGGKVYGVCTLVREDVEEQCERLGTRGVEWDSEGRVLITELEFRSGRESAANKMEKLMVINGYWPNGTANTWRDSNTGVVKGTRHDMKRTFHALMLTEALRHQEAGWQMILIGDINIARSSLDGYPGIRLGAEHVRNRKEWNEIFIESEEGLRGVDSWRWIHGERRGYSYHGEKAEEWGRSCDRVDLGIVSLGFIGEGEGEKGTGTSMRLVGAEIWETIEERGASDHVPISVVLDLGIIRKGDEGDVRKGKTLSEY
jgi:exonuclease III